MQVAAKKPPINTVRIRVGTRTERCFVVPRKTTAGLIELLADYEITEAVPAYTVFPDLADPTMRPAAMLKGARLKAGCTQAELAKRLKSSQTAIAAMERGGRPIGKATAMKLAKLFGTDYRLFL